MLKGVSQSFKDRADSAAFWEAWVGAVLARSGLYTMHYPFEYNDGKDHGHSFDLLVSRGDIAAYGTDYQEATCVEVEVKSLSLTFHSTADYPFEEVLVCSQNSFLRKWPGANETKRDFLFVSRQTGNIVWLPKYSPITVGHEITDTTRTEIYKAVKTQKANLRELSDFVQLVKGPYG